MGKIDEERKGGKEERRREERVKINKKAGKR